MNKTLGILTPSLLVLCCLVSASASAQTVGLGYAFGAPGFVTCGCGESEALLQAGGGGEALFRDTIGVGADLAYMAPFQYLSEGVGLLAVNGTYHFKRLGKDRRTQPFVTGGYTLGFGGGGFGNLWNVGGGADYWMTRRVGIRTEVRDHIYSDGGTVHFWGPRIGIVIRGKP